MQYGPTNSYSDKQHTERQAERVTDRQREREGEKQASRQRDRQTNRERQADGERRAGMAFACISCVIHC